MASLITASLQLMEVQADPHYGEGSVTELKCACHVVRRTTHCEIEESEFLQGLFELDTAYFYPISYVGTTTLKPHWSSQVKYCNNLENRVSEFTG